MEELKTRLENRQSVLNPPPPESAIWRYYSLDKFLCLVTSSELFFSPACSFEDPFEGDYGEAAKKKIREEYGDGQYLRDFNTFEFLRNHTYISCWHENEHESDAMWKLYGNSIAIKAKFSKISGLQAWSESEIKQCGRVNYIDYNTSHVNVDNSYLPYFFKRHSFAHEREVRFLIQEHRYNWSEYPAPGPGKIMKIDINRDIEEIVLSPTMEPHVADAIEGMLQKTGVAVAVRRSLLMNRPLW